MMRTCSITLHMNYIPTPTGPPPNYSAWHAGAGAGVVAGADVLALLVVILRMDIVWCIAAVWINVSLWSSRVQLPAAVNVSLSILREKQAWAELELTSAN